MKRATAKWIVCALLLAAVSLPALADGPPNAKSGKTDGAPKDTPATKTADAGKTGSEKAAPKALGAPKAWTQPKIEKLPEADPVATEALKKAYAGVYSARTEGLKRLAATCRQRVQPPGEPKLATSVSNLAWLKDEMLCRSVVTEHHPIESIEESGYKREIKGSSTPEAMASRLDALIGWFPWDVAFKGAVVVKEGSADGVEEFRVWKSDSGFLSSEVYSVTAGFLVRRHDAWQNYTDYTYQDEDGKRILAASKSIHNVGPNLDMVYDVKFKGRQKVGAYSIATVAESTVSVTGVKPTIWTLTLSGLAVDDQATDKMIEAATEKKSDEAVKKTGDKAAGKDSKPSDASPPSKDAAKTDKQPAGKAG
jgi:hypothetical protein